MFSGIAGMTRRKPEFIPDDEIAPPIEPLTRVRVNHPFRLPYSGQIHTGDAIVEVPASLAHTWILNHWAEDVIATQRPR